MLTFPNGWDALLLTLFWLTLLVLGHVVGGLL
jgi:hypothetical protein